MPLTPLAEDVATLAEVAAAIGRPEAWLRRNWLKLALEHDFPRKHPSGWTWPRGALAAWLRALPDAERPHGAGNQPANDNPVRTRDAAYQALLDARYGGTP